MLPYWLYMASARWSCTATLTRHAKCYRIKDRTRAERSGCAKHSNLTAEHVCGGHHPWQDICKKFCATGMAVEDLPAASCCTGMAQRASTTAGDLRTRASFNPSCPDVFRPQAKTCTCSCGAVSTTFSFCTSVWHACNLIKGYVSQDSVSALRMQTILH